MLTTYFIEPTVIFWCHTINAPFVRLATALEVDGDQIRAYSPIAFGGL